jgi:DNA-binding NtrC family response regulator
MLNRRIKMLVADDSETIRSIFRTVAQRSCSLIDLVEVDNGRDCVKALTAGDVDLAFIDVYMPEMSGLDALRGARHIGVKTFVTLMSGADSDKFMDLAQQLNAYEFLRKPFGIRDVEGIIETYRKVIGPTKVLIVDDSMTFRRVVEQVLEASIFRLDCYEAPDGETALAFCERVDFDIVVLDCNMPGLDGLAILDRLRLRGCDAMVVMITGERDKDHEARALKRGAAAFMYKPLSPQQVDTVLHKLFGLRVPDLMAWGSGANSPSRADGVLASQAGRPPAGSPATSCRRGAPARSRNEP